VKKVPQRGNGWQQQAPEGRRWGKGKKKNREKRNEIEKDGKLKFELCVWALSMGSCSLSLSLSPSHRHLHAPNSRKMISFAIIRFWPPTMINPYTYTNTRK
jgi:hypothetical protein